MRRRWKLVGGAGIAGICIAVGILAHSRAVSGDSTSTPSSGDDDTASTTTSTTSGSSDDTARDPFAPYPSPGAIAYEALSAADKAAVDHVHEVIDTTHPAASHEAYGRATAWTSAEADRQIAERQLGLVDTANDGVVP